MVVQSKDQYQLANRYSEPQLDFEGNMYLFQNLNMFCKYFIENCCMFIRDIAL